MNPAARAVLFCLGGLSLMVALAAVAVRGIPTTPFLLLAAWALSRSSPRLHAWMQRHPRLGPLLRDIREGRGISLRLKLWALAAAWVMLGSAALWGTDVLWLRILLISLAILKTLLVGVVLPTTNRT
ncbi:hypothetical protein Spiaf_2297 [Spirochaeta africana DSM 8902]|uniref:DUF454 domain-containing protein n=1 Tax=Spirochaeta africana (strain ATCC 700263 / DSM 8902 / Z-7692) TaxID=889378 RepID=H9ULD7_SPIAZ|nr:hypothetical protein Spiaf_2297 [Spirochaeta africana DSM 8902]